MPKLPDSPDSPSNKRSPHTIHPKNDRGEEFKHDRTKPIETPEGYEFYNGELIGPSSKLTQRDRETILEKHPFFQ